MSYARKPADFMSAEELERYYATFIYQAVNRGKSKNWLARKLEMPKKQVEKLCLKAELNGWNKLSDVMLEKVRNRGINPWD